MDHLPPHVIRESRRARHVRLSLSMHDGLIVTIPEGFNCERIPGILAEKDSWIRKHAAQLEVQRQQHGITSPDTLPDRIEFPAVDQGWAVRYEIARHSRSSVRAASIDHLLVTTPTAAPADRRKALQAWLLRQGHGHLKPTLLRCASEVGFPVKRVRIGCQKGRWGSCSSRGTISLNAKLLFLPPDWVHYVLMHELCHTREMNHSPRFWQLLEHHVPEAREIRSRLRKAWTRIPAWTARPSS